MSDIPQDENKLIVERRAKLGDRLEIPRATGRQGLLGRGATRLADHHVVRHQQARNLRGPAEDRGRRAALRRQALSNPTWMPDRLTA